METKFKLGQDVCALDMGNGEQISGIIVAIDTRVVSCDYEDESEEGFRTGEQYVQVRYTIRKDFRKFVMADERHTFANYLEMQSHIKAVDEIIKFNKQKKSNF